MVILLLISLIGMAVCGYIMLTTPSHISTPYAGLGWLIFIILGSIAAGAF